MRGVKRLLGQFFSRLLSTRTRGPHPNRVIQTGLAHARNLDDPFSDPEAQERVAKVIAEKALKGRTVRGAGH
jgi:hypothetical protein